jgi:putative acetyltransferase
MLQICLESPEDIPQVRTINEHAFGQSIEADLVDALRKNCPDALSFVAEEGGRIVGHILLTPVVISGSHRTVQGMGLGPMAVRPESQRRGIGSRLIGHGLEILRKSGCPFVVVLGHPEYYPRFGFEPASRYHLRSQWPGVPDEAFMIFVLDREALRGVSGVAVYRDEFNEAL